MAHYTYKDVCYSIPEHIAEAFIKEHGREPDGDPGYDGDYWTLASMWIDEKDAEIGKLRADLAAKERDAKLGKAVRIAIHTGGVGSDEPDEIARYAAELRVDKSFWAASVFEDIAAALREEADHGDV